MALVNYTGKNVFGVMLKGGELVRLLPGINEVPEERLALLKAHPLFQARINKKLVQIMGENIGKDGKRSVEDMLEHIPKIFDIKLLKKLIDSDGRAPVIKAAQLQLDTIRNPSKVKAEQENDDHFK